MSGAVSALTEVERAVLLQPCDCGHSINNHGGWAACWTCLDDNRECATNFEDILCARVAVIVTARTTHPAPTGEGETDERNAR